MASARALPAETNPALPVETNPIAVSLSSLAGGRSLGGGELVVPTLMALAGDGSVRVGGGGMAYRSVPRLRCR